MSLYRREFLFIDEGEDKFHELVHFWQHVGTTFGAYQMIGYLIINKALNIALKNQVRQESLTLPLTSESIDEIFKNDSLSQSVKNIKELSSSLFAKESENTLNKLIPIPTSIHTFYSRKPNPEGSPYFKAAETFGYEIGALAVMEFHNYVITKSKNRNYIGRAVEECLYKKIIEVFGTDVLTQLAFICDWALMVPNKNWTKRKIVSEEFHPGWRLLLSLERLKDKKINLEKYKHYDELITMLSKISNWTSQEEILQQYLDYMEFAEIASNSKYDANRNKNTYNVIYYLVNQTYKARQYRSDIFALPHKYENELIKKLPPLAIKKGNSLYLNIQDGLKKGYMSYITNLSLLKQFYGGKNSIKCLYHYLKITDSCIHLRQSDLGPENCFAFPKEETKKYINCPFVEFWDFWLGAVKKK